MYKRQEYNTLAVCDSEYLDLLFPELPSPIHTLEIWMDFDDFDLNSVLLGLPSSIKRISIPRDENEESISPNILKNVADGCRLDFLESFSLPYETADMLGCERTLATLEMLPRLKEISIQLKNKTSFELLSCIFKSSLLAERMSSLCITSFNNTCDDILKVHYSDNVIEQQCHKFHLRSLVLRDLPNQMTNSILSILPDKNLRYLEVRRWYVAFSL